jgi:plastocyanin
VRLRRFTLFAAGAGALLLAMTPAAAAPQTYVVVIDKLKFGPIPKKLHKGDTIIWANKDILRHTATAANHSFDVDLPAGAKGKTVLKTSGSIPFVCRFHPGMRGVLRVQ